MISKCKLQFYYFTGKFHLIYTNETGWVPLFSLSPFSDARFTTQTAKHAFFVLLKVFLQSTNYFMYWRIINLSLSLVHFFKDYFFLERGKGRKKRGTLTWEKTSIAYLFHGPQLETEPATQACALTGIEPFALQDDAQPTEPYPSEPLMHFFKINF